MTSIGYALAGLALYSLGAHVAGFLSIMRLRGRVGRLEEVFRRMGVVFPEDGDGPAG
jgi:hypothetical protein